MNIHLNFGIGDTVRVPWGSEGAFVVEEIRVLVERSIGKLAQCVPYSVSIEYHQVDPPTDWVHQKKLIRIKRG